MIKYVHGLDSWLEKEKKRLLDEIAEDIAGQIHPENTQKELITFLLVGGIILLIGATFTSCSDKSSKAAEDAAYEATIEAHKDSMIANGAEKYEIVTHEDEKTCKQCGAMSGKVFGINDFSIGANAPPFHSNCRCSIETYSPEEVEDEKPEEEPIYVTEQQLLDLGWHNVTEALVKDLNFALRKYDITTSDRRWSEIQGSRVFAINREI